MKKILTSLLVIITCFVLVGCGNKKQEEREEVKSEGLENVTMIIKEGTLTRTGATVIITDTNENPYYYGSEFWIEKKENEKWEKLEYIGEGNYGWNLMAYHVDENNQLEFEENWEYIYGELKDGEYRIVKDVCISDGCTKKKEFYARFTINSINGSFFNEVNPEIKEKIKDTKRIAVYKGFSEYEHVKSIVEEKEVKNILDLLVHATKNTDEYETSEASYGYLEFYDSDDKLIANVYIWSRNRIGFVNEKEYKLDTKTLMELFEK